MNSNNNQSYLIKLQYDNEVRRFRVENDSFEQFLVVVQNILKINTNDHEFFYNDPEGDQIKFSSDIEFSYALTSSPSPLRVNIVKKNEKTNSNEGNLRELISEVDQISIQTIKSKIQEINQKIKATKEASKQIKISLKEKRGDKKGYFDETNENEKKEKLALFQYSLEIYELKLMKRSLFMQLKSLHKGNQMCKREWKNQSQDPNIGDQPNIDFAQLRQSIWELKEKSKSIKVQIRSIKLLMNSMNSETQKTDLQKQLNDLKSQKVQLKEEKFKLCSQFKQSRRRLLNNNNNNNNSDFSDDFRGCKKQWKGKGKGMGMGMGMGCLTPEEREQRREQCKQRKEKIIAIRKRIIEIKSTKDFQKNDQSVAEIKALKEQIQSLRSEQKACWKRQCPNSSKDENNQ